MLKNCSYHSLVSEGLTLFSMALLVALKSIFSAWNIGCIIRCMCAMNELSTGESRPRFSIIKIFHIRYTVPVVTEEPMKLMIQVCGDD